MTSIAVITVTGAISPTGFAVVVWGSISLVTVVFGYLVWTLLRDRSTD